MPPNLYDRRRVLQLGLAVAAGTVGATIFGPATRAWADTGGYPYAAYNGPGSDPASYIWTDANGQWYSDRYIFIRTDNIARFHFIN